MKYKSKYNEATPESADKLGEIQGELNKAFKNSILFIVPEKDNSEKGIHSFTFVFKTSVKDDPMIDDIIYETDGKVTIKPSEKAFESVKEILNRYGFNGISFQDGKIEVK